MEAILPFFIVFGAGMICGIAFMMAALRAIVWLHEAE